MKLRFKVGIKPYYQNVLILCNDFLKHDLGLPDGVMRSWCRRPHSMILGIAVAYYYDKAIGSAIICRPLKNESVNLGVYVHPDYRRNGIARALFQKLKEHFPNEKLIARTHDLPGYAFYFSMIPNEISKEDCYYNEDRFLFNT